MTALAAEGLTAKAAGQAGRTVRSGPRRAGFRRGDAVSAAPEALWRQMAPRMPADQQGRWSASMRESLTGAPPALLMRVLTLALAQLSELAPHDAGSRPDISIAAEAGRARSGWRGWKNLANAPA